MKSQLATKLKEVEFDQEALSETEIAAYYREARSAFRLQTRRMKNISKGTGGFLSTGPRMYWSSVLFTRLTVMSQSILEMAPSPQPSSHWDFSALGSLVRNFSECYLVMRFMCTDQIGEDEREARVLMMHLHDNFSRYRMLSEIGLGDQQKAAFESNKIDLETRVCKNEFFKNLPDQKRKSILKADRTPFVQDDILDEIKMNRALFRGAYRLFSSHTHTGPIAFYRMTEFGSGRGVENSVDKTYMAFALEFASDFAERACVDLLSVFPNAETRGTQVSDKRIAAHVRKMMEAQERGEFIAP